MVGGWGGRGGGVGLECFVNISLHLRCGAESAGASGRDEFLNSVCVSEAQATFVRLRVMVNSSNHI